MYSFVRRSLFTFTNSVDPDEMQQYAAFHLGLHLLQKYSHIGLIGNGKTRLESSSVLGPFLLDKTKKE